MQLQMYRNTLKKRTIINNKKKIEIKEVKKMRRKKRKKKKRLKAT